MESWNVNRSLWRLKGRLALPESSFSYTEPGTVPSYQIGELKDLTETFKEESWKRQDRSMTWEEKDPHIQ